MRKRTDDAGIDIRSFAEEACATVSGRLGEGYQVKLQEITKNNGVILQGLMILSEECNVSPTIYLNSYLNAYESGIPMPDIADKIMEAYRDSSVSKNVDMAFFRDFERVRERICYRLINRDMNRALLERIPNIDFLDLSICFYYAYQDDALGAGSILIHNNHTEMWNCGVADLLKLAQENTPVLFPWKLYSMEEILREIAEEEGGRAKEDFTLPGSNMHVLSNVQRVSGAASLLYPGILREVSDSLGGDLYVIPSSVHEMILLADDGSQDPEMLRDMIGEINATQVDPEEILSDNLYVYDRHEDKIMIF